MKGIMAHCKDWISKKRSQNTAKNRFFISYALLYCIIIILFVSARLIYGVDPMISPLRPAKSLLSTFPAITKSTRAMPKLAKSVLRVWRFEFLIWNQLSFISLLNYILIDYTRSGTSLLAFRNRSLHPFRQESGDCSTRELPTSPRQVPWWSLGGSNSRTQHPHCGASSLWIGWQSTTVATQRFHRST